MDILGQHFGEIAALLGDKARAIMLWNLLDGRAYTATELAVCANISAQSASNHLSKLVKANFLTVEKQGRHRYYKYATPAVAQAIESIASLLPETTYTQKEKSQPIGVKHARTCYDHLAGKVGVGVTDALVNLNLLKPVDKDYEVTPAGINWFKTMAIDVATVQLEKRNFATQCLDWSERRHHLAGALGASLLHAMLTQDWIRRKKHSREIIITGMGKTAFYTQLRLEL